MLIRLNWTAKSVCLFFLAKLANHATSRPQTSKHIHGIITCAPMLRGKYRSHAHFRPQILAFAAAGKKKKNFRCQKPPKIFPEINKLQNFISGAWKELTVIAAYIYKCACMHASFSGSTSSETGRHENEEHNQGKKHMFTKMIIRRAAKSNRGWTCFVSDAGLWQRRHFVCALTRERNRSQWVIIKTIKVVWEFSSSAHL